MKYNPAKIERKWQRYWGSKKLYQAKDKSSKPKYYQLETFPYPSAAGLHVGHPKGYIAEDIHARYMRMNGKEVMYTMGWDAFGLPTENYAIKVGKSPKDVAKVNIKNFKRQLKMFGFSYDWDREINTSSPKYYKWTQWIFIQLFKAGLAYQKLAKVNWCSGCMTVLANEQVVDGKCDRCGTETTQKEMKQWFFKITDYAERLIGDLENLDPAKSRQGGMSEAGWPAATIKKQKDWIGRSEGALIKFITRTYADSTRTNADSQHKSVPGPYKSAYIEVFTTRPDTLFGATYLVLAPEHLLLQNYELQITNYEEVKNYVEKAKHKTELQRKEETGEKTGVELKGIKAINPANNEEIPIWVADYVLGGYGTGAIMAVPSHDSRDWDFAEKYNLPKRFVVVPDLSKSEIRNPKSETNSKSEIPNSKQKEVYVGNGTLVNSDKFNGIDSEKAKWEITKFVGGKRQVQYKLRDWSVSRQRYWGVPIPIIYCKECALREPSGQGVIPVPEKDLPVKLPDLKDYRPKGMPPLASSDKFLKVKCPVCGGSAQRDPETLDTFVDSSWYYLRYTDPNNKNKFADEAKLKNWLPVKLYVIGAEHSVLHLLYARFIAKVLHDQGYLNFKEPFLKLRHLGLILGSDGQKMSKSKGNVVNPDEVVGQYGADAVRLYEMFMGPFEDSQPWDTKGLVGTHRFLNRVWNLVTEMKEPKTPDKEANKIINKSIKEIGGDIVSFKFNTAVSGLMKLVNALEDKWLTKEQYGTFLKLLAPFAPHIAEELWSSVLRKKKSIHLESWPEYSEALLQKEMTIIVIQVNGRVRDTVEMKKGLSENEIKEIIMERERVKSHIEDKKIKKFIYVKDRLTNIVI